MQEILWYRSSFSTSIKYFLKCFQYNACKKKDFIEVLIFKPLITYEIQHFFFFHMLSGLLNFFLEDIENDGEGG